MMRPVLGLALSLAVGIAIVGCAPASTGASGSGPSVAVNQPVPPAPTQTNVATPVAAPVPGSAAGLKIGYISTGESIPFVRLLTQGVQKYVEQAGGKFVLCDAKLDAAVALACAQNFKTQRVDGILNGQIDQASAPAICAAGPNVPVIALSLQQPPCQKSVVGADDAFSGQLAGYAVGVYAKQHFNCQYDAYISLQATAAGSTNTARMHGYDTGFSSVCGPIKNEKVLDSSRTASAESAFIDELTTLPGMHRIIVVSINDDAVLGALAAAKAQGRQGDVYVSGQGADPSSWCGIKSNPQWIAETAYFPEKWAEIAVPELIDLIKGKSVPAQAYYPSKIINAQNIEQYYHPTGC